MRNLILFTLISVLMAGCHNPQKKDIPFKAVFIIVDGIPADAVERLDPPNLKSISSSGGYSRAWVGGEKGTYCETPTISAPGYMDLLTATWANKHNVWNNYNQSPAYAYKNIFRIAKEVKPAISTAIFSTWKDNRTELIGEGKGDAGSFKFEYSFDGFELDTISYPHDAGALYIKAIDKLVAAKAASFIADNGPDLSWVYLEYTDDAGHRYGDSPQMDSAIQFADSLAGLVWNSVKVRQSMGENWMIVVTTDHGRDPVKGKSHGGQSDRERTTWLVTNISDLNRRFKEGNLPITDITPSILKFMNIEVPEEAALEMDGVSFVDSLAFDRMSAELQGDSIMLRWRPWTDNGDINILVSFTNNFRTGGKDDYELLSEVPLKQGTAVIQLDSARRSQLQKNGLMKIALKSQLNTANKWIIKGK